MSLPKIRLERCRESSAGVWLLDGEQARHLTKSLRLYEGALVEGLLGGIDASDCNGRRLGKAGRDGKNGRKFLLRLERRDGGYLLKEMGSSAESPDALSITLLIGLLKSDQFESVLRVSAELGVFAILPVECERSVPRIKDGDLDRKMARWRKIIDEGSKVSGAVIPPLLMKPVRFTGVDWRSLPHKRFAALLSPGTAPLKESYCAPAEGPDELVFAVGPEGDWSEAEAASLLDNAFVPVSLGSRVLRASTAALVGCGWFRLSTQN